MEKVPTDNVLFSFGLDDTLEEFIQEVTWVKINSKHLPNLIHLQRTSHNLVIIHEGYFVFLI